MKDIFKNLNPQQREAVKEIYKPLQIIAGAGSGKTLTVASKVAYLIQKGVKPENILALTFNEKAAEELLNKVTDVLGDSEDIQISTFHSFCNQIIQDNILDTKLNADFSVITETAQLVYFVKNINNFGLEYLEFNHEPYTLAEEVNKFISRCKDEFISPTDIEIYIKIQSKKKLGEEEQNDLNNLKDILKIYESYEEYKNKNNMLDFGDMLFIVFDLFKNKPIILKRYQERFQYVIVDEFQDTNYIQLQIVNLIAQKHGHITVVGDDDQSIYRFRGAYLTNIAEFKKLFPSNVEKALEQNYRSTKNILAVANKLIENKHERTVKKLFTNNAEGEKVSVIETQADEDQANFILKAVKELLKKYTMKDIAILCRRRASADKIIEVFRKHSIPFHFVGESGFFQEPIIKDAIAYLRVIDNPVEYSVEIVRILHREIYGIKKTDIARFNTYAADEGIDLYEVFNHLDEIGVDKKRFIEVKKVLDDLIKSKNKLKMLELVHMLLFETDFYKNEIILDNKKNIALLNQFYKFVEDYDRLYQNNEIKDLIDYLSYASNFEVEEEDADENSINISTIHGVKGMEFPVVIIPDVVERKLPTTHRKDKFVIPSELLKGVKSKFDDKEIHIQEERRLMYVGITRAKEKLFIVYAKRYGENVTDSKPSRFLEEIGYENNKNINFEAVEVDKLEVEETAVEQQIHTVLMKETVSALRIGDYNAAIEKILLMAKAINEDMDIRKEIISKIKEPEYEKIMSQIKNGTVEKEKLIAKGEKVFSVSQFNTWKRCPRIYLYHYLLNVPTKPKYFFDFGGSIHRVVEELTKMIKEGRKVDYKIALELFKRNWNPKGYKSKIDEKRDYEEAKEILKVFLEEQEKMETDIVDIERDFITEIDGIKVRGRIDRIDKDGSDYIVIDYKTAKVVASKTEIKEDLQLLLYSLVTEHLYNKMPKKIGLWFLRPNKQVFIDVEDEAIESIKKQIKEIVGSIMAENFDPTPGWECRNCDYDCLCDECKK